MVAINHAVSGALIGLTVASPLACPLAFLSHFVLDAIPHFGDDDKRIRKTSFVLQLMIDALLCGLLVIILLSTLGSGGVRPSICAFLAASPDFMWMPDYLRIRRGRKPLGKTNIILRFHSMIQWFQKPIGSLVEIAWLASALLLLVNII